MTTRVLEAPTDRWVDAADWVCDVLADEGLTRARNTVGSGDVAVLDLLVDRRLVASVRIDGSFGQACGVSLASALLERQSRGDCETWEVRLSVPDDEVGADLLIREWRCPD